MSEATPNPPSGDITDNDRLMAALSYPIPLVAIVILLVEEMKARPFQKYHAVQALAVNIALWVVIGVLACIVSIITAGLCGFAPVILWLPTLFWAYQAYQGTYVQIPWLTEFLKKQNWL